MLGFSKTGLVISDFVLQIMSGRIFGKCDIAPKAQLDPNTLKLSVCNTGIGLNKAYISDFSFH